MAKSLAEIREIHRAGHLREAREQYDAHLRREPRDADATGLLGVLALQEGRLSEAEELLSRSLGLPSDPPVRLRNLNNLVALLQDDDRAEGIPALLADAPVDWPEGKAPDARERVTLLSLIEALLRYGQASKARHLLRRAFPDRQGDAELLNLEGRLLLDEGEPASAAEILAEATRIAPTDLPPLLALAVAEAALGDRAKARETTRRVAVLHPVWSAPSAASQRADVLVLNPTPRLIETPGVPLERLHFLGNYAAQIRTRLAHEYRFHSVFGDLAPSHLPAALPEADVVLNNLVNGEVLNVPGKLDRLNALIARIGLPVINHPDQVARTTRQMVALALEGIPGLKVPRIRRYRLHETPADEVARDIAAAIGFPVILRTAKAHESSIAALKQGEPVAVLLADRNALRDHLGRTGWNEVYAIEYVDLRRPDGNYRKLRACCIGDEVILTVPSAYRTWMVTSGRNSPAGIAFYRENPAVVAECSAIVRDPWGMLGEAAHRVLTEIRARIPLDAFGIDFEVDPSGDVVLFEATAAMLFLNHLTEPDFVRLPPEPFERVNAAFGRLVDRKRSEGVAAAALSAQPTPTPANPGTWS